MNQEKIGIFISKCRKKKNLTQEQLAEKLNTTSKSISRWENGKTMPDISIMIQLCDVLDISINELLSGEKLSKDNLKKETEKLLLNNVKTIKIIKKKNSKLKIITITTIIILIILITTLLVLYKIKYPKIDIYNIQLIPSIKEELGKKQTIKRKENNIYFYGTNSLRLYDINENYYDFNEAIKHKQTTILELKNYLNMQYKNDNIQRYILYDGGTEIYKNKKYTIILCNTLEKNNDIYIGTPKAIDNLKGNYCGHKKINTCTFTRTYKILNISEHDEEEFINVTLKEFQGTTSLVKVYKDANIKVGYYHEFTFQTYQQFEDTINNIFENSTLIEIKTTTKTGLEQKNEKICVNS